MSAAEVLHLILTKYILAMLRRESESFRNQSQSMLLFVSASGQPPEISLRYLKHAIELGKLWK
ncbi:MAG: hypothetical protein CMP47_15260 [Rickettsiales bacterium]|nr:hypothetical protein [Rickettsiales bacterium]